MQSSAEAKRKCNFSNSGRPPHLIMGFGFTDYGKAKPFIEAPGWIHFHHLQPEWNLPLLGLGEQYIHDGSAQSLVLMIRENHNIEELDFVLSMIHGDITDILTGQADDLNLIRIERYMKAGDLGLIIPLAKCLLNVSAKAGLFGRPHPLAITVLGGPKRMIAHSRARSLRWMISWRFRWGKSVAIASPFLPEISGICRWV